MPLLLTGAGKSSQGLAPLTATITDLASASGYFGVTLNRAVAGSESVSVEVAIFGGEFVQISEIFETAETAIQFSVRERNPDYWSFFRGDYAVQLRLNNTTIIASLDDLICDPDIPEPTVTVAATNGNAGPVFQVVGDFWAVIAASFTSSLAEMDSVGITLFDPLTGPPQDPIQVNLLPDPDPYFENTTNWWTTSGRLDLALRNYAGQSVNFSVLGPFINTRPTATISFDGDTVYADFSRPLTGAEIMVLAFTIDGTAADVTYAAAGDTALSRAIRGDGHPNGGPYFRNLFDAKVVYYPTGWSGESFTVAEEIGLLCDPPLEVLNVSVTTVPGENTVRFNILSDSWGVYVAAFSTGDSMLENLAPSSPNDTGMSSWVSPNLSYVYFDHPYFGANPGWWENTDHWIDLDLSGYMATLDAAIYSPYAME